MTNKNSVEHLFTQLFKKYYATYSNEKTISKTIVLQAREHRFKTDEYWKIWKQYGVFAGFIEGFFHQQDGVNRLPIIFEKYPLEVTHFANAQQFLKRFKSDKEVLNLLEDCGILRMRNQHAKHIYIAAQNIVETFNNKVPDTRDALLSFIGYGPKISNMVLNTVFDKAVIAIDIRVFRACVQLGFIKYEMNDFKKAAVKFAVEKKLYDIVPDKFLIEADYLLFMAGGDKSIYKM